MLRKRILAAATATILALGMSMGGASAALASGNPNDAPYWEAKYSTAEAPVDCVKFDPPTAANPYGSIVTVDGKTSVLLVAPPEGKVYHALIVKGGTADNEILNPQVGVNYFAPNNASGGPAGVSHWIVCLKDVPPQVASASIAFTDPTCESAQGLNEAGFSTTGATLTSTNIAGLTYTVVFTANSGYKFPAGPNVTNNGGTLTLTGELDPALTGEDCDEDVDPEVASASIAFTDPTCESAQGLNEAGFSATGATLTSTNIAGLTYTVVFTANSGFEFPAGPNVTNNGGTLTLTGELDPALTGEDCDEDVDPEVASASIAFTDPTCESAQGLNEAGFSATGATLTSTNIAGLTYTVVFTANSGFEFPAGPNVTNNGGTLTLTGDLDPALTGEECLGSQEPSVEASLIATECDTDVPFILFSVALNDPDGVSTDDGNVYLVFSDGVNEERIKIAELDENGQAEGRILWPGAALTDGIASGWPGWELIDGQWTNVGDANFGWTRVLTSATIEINPELEVELNYPDATPDCVVDPQPIEPMIDVEPFDCFFGGSYELPFIDGVIWSVDGEVVDSGIYPVLVAGTEVTVTASLDPAKGLYFADGAESVWNLEFTEPELGCGELPTFPLVTPSVTVSQPTCDTANGSYTLSATEGVTWFVNGVERAAGTYQSAAGTSVSIEAVANEGFGFGFEQQTEWNVTFTAPSNCDLPELETLALTGVTGLAGMAGLVALLITLTGVGMVAARRRVEV